MEILDEVWIINPTKKTYFKKEKAAVFTINEIQKMVADDMGINFYEGFSVPQRLFNIKCQNLSMEYGGLLFTQFFGKVWFETEKDAKEAIESLKDESDEAEN